MVLKVLPLLALPLQALGASGESFTWVGSILKALHWPHHWEHVFTFFLVGIVVLCVGILYRRKVQGPQNLAMVDGKISLKNLVEIYGSFIRNQCHQVIGRPHGDDYFSFIAVLFLMIFLSNAIGLIPGFLPPTEHMATTLALGLFSFVFYNLMGIKKQGFLNYIKHFAGPLWYLAILIFPIEIISNLIRPVSLALRLRSNMMGDHIVLAQFSDLVPFVVPIIFMALGLLVSLIQAYVFTALSMVYINLAVSHHDH